VQAMAHSFAYPPLAYSTNAHEGSLGREAPLARVTPGVVPTAMGRSEVDGSPALRVYNAAGAAVDAEVEVPAGSEGASLVDLMERPTGEPERVDGAWRFPLRPWEIGTLRFGRR
ncbi:MAG: glycosyl hydrolase-related protein, partial [Tepidiformaceae bacterium]